MSNERYTSAPNVTVFGDLTVHPVDNNRLPPGSQGEQNATFRIPKREVQRLRNEVDTVHVSLKSSLAQAGLELLTRSFDLTQTGEIMGSLVNCGWFDMCFTQGNNLNLGAAHSFEQAVTSMRDTRDYVKHLQSANPHIQENEIQVLSLDKPYVWIETPKLFGTPKSVAKYISLDAHKLPRGSRRTEMAQALGRQMIATRQNPKVQYDYSDLGYSILETSGHIQGVLGTAFHIEGYAVLTRDSRVALNGLHGESRLILQPQTTAPTGRDAHGVIGEIFEYPANILEYWKNRLQIGFYGTPVNFTNG